MLPLVARHRVGLGGNSTNIVFVPAKLALTTQMCLYRQSEAGYRMISCYLFVLLQVQQLKNHLAHIFPVTYLGKAHGLIL